MVNRHLECIAILTFRLFGLVYRILNIKCQPLGRFGVFWSRYLQINKIKFVNNNTVYTERQRGGYRVNIYRGYWGVQIPELSLSKVVKQRSKYTTTSFEPDVALICSCLSSYHSNTEAVLFACLSSSWATTTCKLLGPKVGNSFKCLSQGHSDALPHRESNQGFV